MRYYSTKNPAVLYSLKEAVLKSLPEDNGLFMPECIPRLPGSFFSGMEKSDLTTIACEVSRAFLTGDVPEEEILKIARESLNFPIPLVKLNDDTSVLELFHGPTLAFKDLGARFMARVMSWLNRDETRKLTILVATSGDTGSAVADGFFGVEGIEVIILYPSGKVSPLQEKQLTTHGQNITALEISGSFDDCQSLVKRAFLDLSLREKYRLSSANSINIARLIPQSIYYLEAGRQVQDKKKPLVISVPSGNFGNLTAGLFARRMGLPVSVFVAATNKNDAFPLYLSSGKFQPVKTRTTISNAMDVGSPSNLARMDDLSGNDIHALRREVMAFSFDDEQTRNAMRWVFRDLHYMLDPHGAVGWLGWEKYNALYPGCQGIVLETAHPAKFREVVAETLQTEPELPGALRDISGKEKISILLRPEYALFQEYLRDRK